MRIAFFSDTFYPSINGVVTTIVETASFLQARGHEVLVIVPRHSNLKFDRSFSFEIHQTPSVSGIVYPDFMIGLPDPGLLKVIRKFQPDIIHTHGPFMLGLQGVLLAKYLKIPLISTYHTHFSDRESLKALGLENVPMIDQVLGTVGRLFRFFYNKHDVVVAPSEDTARDLINYGVHVPIKVLPSAVDIENMKKGKKKGLLLRKKYKIDQALIYVGRMSGEKCIDKIITLFYHAQLTVPKLSLVLIGEGPAQKKLLEQAQEYGITDKIISMGRIPHQDIISEGYYYLGDVFVTMSKWETLGLSTIEAMACGLPIVAARARANIENVRNVGILVDLEDQEIGLSSVLDLLQNSKKNNELAKLSLAKSEQFSPEIIIKKLEKMYQHSIDQKLKNSKE